MNKTQNFFSNPPMSIRQQLWMDLDTGKSTRIIEVTNKDNNPALQKKKKEYVETKDVYGNGADVRKRINYSTGLINYKERQYVSSMQSDIPVYAQQPNFISTSSKKLYTPAITKIDGYAQHPRPIEKPYQNKIQYTNECKTREYLPKQKKSMSMYRQPVTI